MGQSTTLPSRNWGRVVFAYHQTIGKSIVKVIKDYFHPKMKNCTYITFLNGKIQVFSGHWMDIIRNCRTCHRLRSVPLRRSVQSSRNQFGCQNDLRAAAQNGLGLRHSLDYLGLFSWLRRYIFLDKHFQRISE